MHYLRPVPGHAGRVKRDITSAPDQAACTISDTILLQILFASHAGADTAYTAPTVNSGQLW
jgi:hypothetical protein